jgi:hypothetical protein
MHSTTRVPHRAASIDRNRHPEWTSGRQANDAAEIASQPPPDGSGLDPDARVQLERSFGHSLEHIRVHADAAADALTREHHARALASGAHIYFRDGEYAPDTPGGLHLLSHETAHALQQDAARRDGRGPGRDRGHGGDAFELDAHAAADAVMTGRPASVNAPAAGVGVQCEDEDETSFWDVVGNVVPAVAVAREAMEADSVGDFFMAERAREAERAGMVRTAEGWLDGGVNWLEEQSKAGSAAMAESVADVPVLGTVAQGLRAAADFQTDMSGGFVKGIGGLVGGLVQMGENPIGTIEGLAKMSAESMSSQTIGAGVTGIINAATGDGEWSDIPGGMWEGMQKGFMHDVGIVDHLLHVSESVEEGKPGEIVGRVGANLLPFILSGGASSGAGAAAEGASVAADAAAVADIAAVGGDVAAVADVAAVGGDLAAVADVAAVGGDVAAVADVAAVGGDVAAVADVAAAGDAAALGDVAAVADLAEGAELLEVAEGASSVPPRPVQIPVEPQINPFAPTEPVPVDPTPFLPTEPAIPVEPLPFDPANPVIPPNRVPVIEPPPPGGFPRLPPTPASPMGSAEVAAEGVAEAGADVEAMLDDVLAEGREIRDASVRAEARDLKLEAFAEEMEGGIRSPETELFARDAGEDVASALADGDLSLAEAEAQVHHKFGLAEAPELGTTPENLELLTNEAHELGAHGGDFNVQRGGGAADPFFDENLGFGGDRRRGVPSIDEGLESVLDDQAVRDFPSREDALIDLIDFLNGL